MIFSAELHGGGLRRIIARVLPVLFLCGVLAAAGCSWVRPAEREGGTLVLAVPGELPVHDPHRAVEPHPLYGAVYDTLLSKTPDLELAPGLAKDWRVLEGGLQVVLSLRGGVVFHDGTPLDGVAVARNIERVMSGSADEFPVQVLLGPLREVNATELEVTLLYDRPFPPVWQALTDPRLAMISPAALERAAAGESASASDSPPGGPELGMPGTGPYVVSECGPGRIVLDRNPQYRWPPGPVLNPGYAYPENLEVVAVTAETGDWDLLWWPAALSLPPAADEETATWRRFTFGGGRMTYLALRAGLAPCSDPLVRQAVLAAVDRPAVQTAAPWPALPALGLLPLAQGGPVGCLAPADRDAAGRMLDSAGWIRGEDGYRRKNGELLELRLATYEDDPDFANTAGMLCADLESVGFACRVVAVRPQGDPGLVPPGPNAWLLYYQWPDPDVLYYLFHSSQVGRANRVGYANDLVDSLLDAARTEIDPAVRTSLYQEAQALILGDGYVLPLFESQGEVRISPRIAGFRSSPDGRLLLHDVYLRQSP